MATNSLEDLYICLQFVTNYYEHEQKFSVSKSRWYIIFYFHKVQTGANLFFTDHESEIGFYFYNENNDTPKPPQPPPKFQSIFLKLLLKCV